MIQTNRRNWFKRDMFLSNNWSKRVSSIIIYSTLGLRRYWTRVPFMSLFIFHVSYVKKKSNRYILFYKCKNKLFKCITIHPRSCLPLYFTTLLTPNHCQCFAPFLQRSFHNFQYHIFNDITFLMWTTRNNFSTGGTIKPRAMAKTYNINILQSLAFIVTIYSYINVSRPTAGWKPLLYTWIVDRDGWAIHFHIAEVIYHVWVKLQ